MNRRMTAAGIGNIGVHCDNMKRIKVHYK
jgi:hypothetical protein